MIQIIGMAMAGNRLPSRKSMLYADHTFVIQGQATVGEVIDQALSNANVQDTKPNIIQMNSIYDAFYAAKSQSISIVLDKNEDRTIAFVVSNGLSQHPQAMADIVDHPFSFGLVCAPFGNHLTHRFGKRIDGEPTMPFIDISNKDVALGVFMTTLALWQRILPPCKITWQSSDPFYSDDDLYPWINHGPLEALIWDGQNDLVLREPKISRPWVSFVPWPCELYLFNAMTVDELINKIEHIDAVNPFLLVQQIRHDYPVRLAIVAKNHHELLEKIRVALDRIHKQPAEDIETSDGIFFCANANKSPGKVVALFPGQGFPGLMGNYSQHLKDLCLRFLEIRQVFDQADLRENNKEDRIPLHHMFFPPSRRPSDEREKMKLRVASPVIADVERCKNRLDRKVSMLALSVANWAAWSFLKAADLKVDAVFGQSLGELAALAAAGSIKFEEMVTLLQAEPDFDTSFYGFGRMFAATGNLDQINAMLKKYPSIAIAVYVSPEFHLLAGDEKEVLDMVKAMEDNGQWVHLLPYPGIHTPKMSGLVKAGKTLWDAIKVKTMDIPVYSGTTASLYPTDPDQIRARMIANYDHPVRLWQTILKMFEDGFRVFVQAGGGSTMHAQAKTNVGASNENQIVATSFDVEYRDAPTQLQHLIGLLWSKGVRIDPTILFRHRVAMTTQNTMPFIGKVKRHGNHAVAVERMLDIDVDLHLRDHVFVPAKGIKEAWQCMPVMPVTMTLEAMAQVSSLLAEGQPFNGFKDIQANRWVALEDQKTAVMRITAEKREDGIYCSVFLNDEQMPRTTGVVCFGEIASDVSLDFTDLTKPASYDISVEDVYRSGYLFHGPTYEGIRSITAIFENGILGQIEVTEKDKLFRDMPNPTLLSDPVFMDVMGQLFGLYAIPQKKYIFPLRIQSIDFLKPWPCSGTVLDVWVKITKQSFSTMTADMAVVNDQGDVLMVVKGWEDWIFRWPDRYYGIRRRPEKYLFAIPQGLNFILLDERNRLSKADLDFLKRVYLSSSEYTTVQSDEDLFDIILRKDAIRAAHARNGRACYTHPASFCLVNNHATLDGITYSVTVEDDMARVWLDIIHNNSNH